MITTVIFDWAGTTIDFGSVAPVSAFREAFRQYGIEVSEEETRAPMGMLKIDHIRTMLAAPELAARFEAAKGRRPDESDAQAIYASFEPAQMAVLTQHCDLKPGLIDCVKALRAKGIRIGTTTGFTREMMAVVAPEAERFGYKPDLVVTAEDADGRGRPYPYMIFENMRRLGEVEVRRVLKVGDTVSDIEEARASGVWAAAVLEGSSVMGLTRAEWDALSEAGREAARAKARAVFEAAGAQFILRNLDEVPILAGMIA